MKKFLLLILISFLVLPVVSRDLPFEIRGKYSRAVKQGQLSKAHSVRDIIPGYAENWISGDIQVEVLGYHNGKPVKAVGKEILFTVEQKKILAAMDLASHIVINVHYKEVNAATGNMDNRAMHVPLTVVPDNEAAFTGGTVMMNKYINENIMDKLSSLAAEYILDGIVSFTVNESGMIVNARLAKSTGDPQTDSLILSAIKKMPKWNPAVTSKKQHVSQDFEFIIGNQGC